MKLVLIWTILHPLQELNFIILSKHGNMEIGYLLSNQNLEDLQGNSDKLKFPTTNFKDRTTLESESKCMIVSNRKKSAVQNNFQSLTLPVNKNHKHIEFSIQVLSSELLPSDGKSSQEILSSAISLEDLVYTFY